MHSGSPASDSPLSRTSHLPRIFLVFCFLFLVVMLFYWKTLQFSLLSDANSLLSWASQGLSNALRWNQTYHYNPITMAYLFIQYQAFGLDSASYQFFNLIQHVVVGVFVFLLAFELTHRELVAWSASLLFLCSSSYFEVTLWSVVGSYYTLTTSLYLIALLSLVRYVRHREKRYWWLYTLSVSLALFSHEFAVGLFPVSLVYYVLFQDSKGSGGDRWRQILNWKYLRTLLSFFSVSGLTLLVFLAIKLYMASQTAVLVTSPFFETRLFSVARGLISTFSYRSDFLFLNGLVRLGGVPDSLSPVTAFVLVALLTIAFLSFDRLKRFLLIWVLTHLLIMALAIGVSPRHLYLTSIPGSILVAMIVRVVTIKIFSNLKRERSLWISEKYLTTGIHICVVVGILFVSNLDLRKIQRLWDQASEANQMMLDEIREAVSEQTDVSSLYILNPTGVLREEGFFAWLFWNGLPRSIEMHFPDQFSNIQIIYTDTNSKPISGSHKVSTKDLETILATKGNLVVVFSPETWRSQALLPSEASAIIPHNSIYSKETAPYLGWEMGSWPYLSVMPGDTLELSFNPDFQAPYWISLFYARQLDNRIVLIVDDELAARFEPPQEIEYFWTTANVPLQPDFNAEAFTLKAHIDGANNALIGRISIFKPQVLYIKETSPFLTWNDDQRPWLAIYPGDELVLPFPTNSIEVNILRIFYAHTDGREFRVYLNRELIAEINPSQDDASEWRTLTLPLPHTKEDIIVVTLEGAGTNPVMIGAIEITE